MSPTNSQCKQDAEKGAITPTLSQARQDAPYPELRSRLESVLNVPPREGARLGALGVDGCNKIRLRLIPALRPRSGRGASWRAWGRRV
jgi:hypothetical protein